MNKRKVAVFVEGQTELVFVREMLAKWFEYDANVIGFDCYNLLNNSFHDTSYTLGSDQSENYFMLVNVGNDNSVLSKIKARMQQLVRLNYHVVIGLRDMYSAQYIKDAKEHVIKELSTKEWIEIKEPSKGAEEFTYYQYQKVKGITSSHLEEARRRNSATGTK